MANIPCPWTQKGPIVIVLILFHEQFGIVSRVVFEQNNHRQYPDHEVSHSHLKLLAKTKELRHIDWQADKIFLNSDVFLSGYRKLRIEKSTTTLHATCQNTAFSKTYLLITSTIQR